MMKNTIDYEINKIIKQMNNYNLSTILSVVCTFLYLLYLQFDFKKCRNQWYMS